MGNQTTKEKDKAEEQVSSSSSDSEDVEDASPQKVNASSGKIDRDTHFKENIRQSQFVPDEVDASAEEKPPHVPSATKTSPESDLFEKMKKCGVDGGPWKGGKQTLYLDLENNFEGVNTFLTLSKDLEFDSLKKVSIFNNLCIFRFQLFVCKNWMKII